MGTRDTSSTFRRSAFQKKSANPHVAADAARRPDPVESPEFVSFLVELSDTFVRRPAALVTPLIEDWLARLARLIGVDRITLWETPPQGGAIFRRYMYTRPGCKPPPGRVVPARQFAWLMEQNRLGNVVAWSRVPEDIPEEALGEREYGERIGAKSLLSIPIAADSVMCVLAFTSVRRYRFWSAEAIQRLRLVCSIFAGAVARERAEASLRASEARNRAILKALPDLLLVFSPEGSYLEVHCRDESELLRPIDELIGLTLEEAVPPRVAEAFRRGMAEVAHSPEGVEIEYQLKVGNDLREYEARLVRRDDGAIVAIVRNITQRYLAARQLRESEERFRGAFEHSGIGMALVGLDGRWIQTNAANCRILGYSEAELQSRNFQTLTHPDDLGRNLEDYERAIKGEIDHYELEKRYIHKAGHAVPALLTVSVVRDEQGRPLYFVSQLQDLTERKKSQIEIERLRVELARFGRAALTGQLTASIAHHLMQPITAIQTNAEACVRLMEVHGSEHDVRQALEDIKLNCTRAADTVTGVRNMLRKEPGARLAVCINQLVAQVLALMNPYLSLRSVSLSTRLEENLPKITGNPIELQQVVLNLLVNAAEALQNSPGKRAVTLETLKQGAGVEIAVRDTGPGVDPSLLRRIFEPFFTTKPDGIGMGLTISADIVRSHGGTIWAEAGSGGGLSVRCTFPVGRGPCDSRPARSYG